jgi:hypothetical protein
MAAPAARLVGLTAANHDGRGFVQRRPAVDQALVPACILATGQTYRVKFIDKLSNGHQVWYASERLTAEIGIGSGEDHTDTAVRESGTDGDDTLVEELGFINGCHLSVGSDQPHDLQGRVHRLCLDSNAIMRSDGVDAGVSVVEVRLEHLNPFAGYHGATDPANQFLAFAAEHDPGNYFNLPSF